MSNKRRLPGGKPSFVFGGNLFLFLETCCFIQSHDKLYNSIKSIWLKPIRIISSFYPHLKMGAIDSIASCFSRRTPKLYTSYSALAKQISRCYVFISIRIEDIASFHPHKPLKKLINPQNSINPLANVSCA